MRNAPVPAMPVPSRVSASLPTAMLPWICKAASPATVVRPAPDPRADEF